MKVIELMERLLELPEDYEVLIYRPGEGSGSFGEMSPLDSEDIETHDDEKTVHLT